MKIFAQSFISINKKTSFTSEKPYTESPLQDKGSLLTSVVDTSTIVKTSIYSYLSGLKSYKADGGSFYKRSNQDGWLILILNKALPPAKAMEKLKEVMENARGQINYIDLYGSKFQDYTEAIERLPNLKNEKILGILGQGRHSTAFLLDNDRILKMSLDPNFPVKSDFIEGVDVPLLKSGVSKNLRNENIYYSVQPLALSSNLTRISDDQVAKIKIDFENKIKNFNPDYKLREFYHDQIGFINGKPYLFDCDCIKGRPLFIAT